MVLLTIARYAGIPMSAQSSTDPIRMQHEIDLLESVLQERRAQQELFSLKRLNLAAQHKDV